MVAEETGKMAARRYDISVTALRPAWLQYPGKYDCLEIQSAPEYGKPHFWAYCDIRDLKQAVRTAVETPLDGFEAFHVMAADNYMGEPTAELIEQEFDATPETVSISEDAVAYSLAKTRELLNWTPSYSWKTAADEHVNPPLENV
jgi:nucleoside-diphosphate-sugar epimerase